MTSFGKVFKAMFKQKTRLVWTLIVLNLVASLISVISRHKTLVDGSIAEMPKGVSPAVAWLLSYGVVFLCVSVIIDFIYFCITVEYNERINNATTWRLVPISAGKLLGTNYLTSLIDCIMITAIQFVIGLLCFIPVFTDQKVVHAMVYGSFPWSKFFNQTAWFAVTVILSAVLFYALITLLNLGGRAIADFLPVRSGRAIVFVIRLVLFIAMFYVLNYYAKILIVHTSMPDSPWGSALGLFVLDIIVCAIDWLLVERFAEPKTTN